MSLLINRSEAVALAKFFAVVKNLNKVFMSRDVDGNLVVGFINKKGERSPLQRI